MFEDVRGKASPPSSLSEFCPVDKYPSPLNTPVVFGDPQGHHLSEDSSGRERIRKEGRGPLVNQFPRCE